MYLFEVTIILYEENPYNYMVGAWLHKRPTTLKTKKLEVVFSYLPMKKRKQKDISEPQRTISCIQQVQQHQETRDY